MNIDKLTKKLNELKEEIDKYQEQLDILNDNTRFYSYFRFYSCLRFGMCAKMSAWGQSEMPNNYFELPYELKDQIAKLYKEWLEKKIEKLNIEREELIKDDIHK